MANNRILVISPHQDDETITCAGVIRSAVDNGYSVKVAFVTTGDYSEPKPRIQNAINVMGILGLPKENILYLGYGDLKVLGNAYLSKSEPLKVFPGYRSSQTYGFLDLGIIDYHFLKYGTHAAYNRENIYNDITSIIKDELPQKIYIPSPMESHPDHSSTALFVISALIDLRKTIGYAPTVYQYMVYKSGLPQNNQNSLEPVMDYDSRMDSTSPYSWSRRESACVPDEMYAAISSGDNLKRKAFDGYMGALDSFLRFIKSDEVFWKKEMSNLAYVATVTASSQNVSTGQYCSNVINGIPLGYPYKNSQFNLYNNEWATLKEGAGAWIRLEWPGAIVANRVVLYDRPNFTDNIIRGTLTFSDGSRIWVGPLNRNGSEYIIDFPDKTFNWLKFTIDQAEGENTGLSEIEVYKLNFFTGN